MCDRMLITCGVLLALVGLTAFTGCGDVNLDTPEKTITIGTLENGEGCTIIPSPSKAKRGTPVVLAVTVAPGKALEAPTLRANGRPTTRNIDGNFEFTMPDDPVVITATFTNIRYTVSYELGGAPDVPGNPTSYTIVELPRTLSPPSWPGYTYGGWFADAGLATPATAPELPVGSLGNKTFWAKWTGDGYTVMLDSQGGSGGTISINVTSGTAMPAATAPTRMGYTFAGYWDATSGGVLYYTAEMSSARTWDKTVDSTLYARWTVTSHAVTLDRQGGSGGTDSVTATYDAAMPAATAPSREGHLFLGYWDATSSGVQYYTAEMSSARAWDKTNDTTLYARWVGGPMVAVPVAMNVSIGWDVIATPVHTVASISAFRMGKYEVTWALWTNVRTWAATNGYSIATGQMGSTNNGDGMTPQHPVTLVSHRDVLAWCNAFSERSGLMPVYYTTSAKTDVYRNSGDSTSPLVATWTEGANDCVDWSANGYRLPTSAEWEYAARRKSEVSLSAGDKPAGYYGSTLYNGATVLADWGPYAWYTGNSGGKTNPVGGKLENALELHDMSGNVWEWCWDWWGNYTTASPYTDANTRGPASGDRRVIRGASWDNVPEYLRAAYRGSSEPNFTSPRLGFRLSRRE